MAEGPGHREPRLVTPPHTPSSHFPLLSHSEHRETKAQLLSHKYLAARQHCVSCHLPEGWRQWAGWGLPCLVPVFTHPGASLHPNLLQKGRRCLHTCFPPLLHPHTPL